MRCRWEENGDGLIDPGPEVRDRVLRFAGQAERGDSDAARCLADIGDRYAAGLIAGRPPAWWREYATDLDLLARAQFGRSAPTTTQEDPVSVIVATSHEGTTPSTLRIERTPNGNVRFRITALGQPEAVCDIPDARIDDVVASLRGGDS